MGGGGGRVGGKQRSLGDLSCSLQYNTDRIPDCLWIGYGLGEKRPPAIAFSNCSMLT